MVMRAWVVENGLLDHTGHHFNNSLALRDACATRHIETRFLVNRHAERTVIDALAAAPVFDYGPYDHASDDPLAGPIENLIIQGQSLAHSIVMNASFGADDLVLVPSTLQNELYGCALALAQIAPERRPRLAMTFIVENFLASGARQLGPTAALYRFGARQLARVCPSARRIYGSNGAQMSEWMSRVLGEPVSTFPIPKGYRSAQRAATTRARGPAPVIGILGHSRADKGFALVPEIVARCPDLRFVVQVTSDSAESLWKERAAHLRSASNVVVARGALPPEGYDALLSGVDIVLLPYDPRQFPLRSSGVFAEAVGAGKVTVVPADTWMSAHVAAARGAGTVFDAFTADAIIAALHDAVARFSALHTAARACAAAWRATQSADVYVERILDGFGSRLQSRSHQREPVDYRLVGRS